MIIEVLDKYLCRCTTLNDIIDWHGTFKDSNNTDKILLQTYVMLEDKDNSEKYAQTIMYNSILNLVSVSALLLSVKMEDRDWCSDTIERIDAINAF